MTRRESREQAFIIIFEKSFNPDVGSDELIELAREYELLEPDDFFRSLIKTEEENDEKIEEVIGSNTRGWKLRRIPKVSLAVLKIALTEILFMDDVPNGVAVNEAVELAKKYATPEDASFINGLLGTVVRSL